MPLIQSAGKRVKLARSMLGLTRKQLDEQFNINANTLQAWESDKNILTDKGAKKLNSVFIKLGLACTEDWLLTGRGQNPVILQNINVLPNNISEDISILREIETFKALNPSPIVIIINDDGMSPFYSVGDFVGGNKKTGTQIQMLIGGNCIIETFQGDILARKLLKGQDSQRYNLACTNIATETQPIIPDIHIRSAAKIVYHRKKED